MSVAFVSFVNSDNSIPIALPRSRNRLELPKEYEIVQLEPHFRHVRSINLRRCNLRQWATVLYIARLWPNIERLALAENSIANLSVPNTQMVFKNLRFLDLKENPLNSFNEVIKLSNVRTLETLLCIGNHIEKVLLPECLPTERLTIFENLKELNMQENQIEDQVSAFNELDKLPSLINLTVTINPKIGFEETFSNAIGYISQLTVLNRKVITATERRGAEYDIWKRHSAQWVKTNESTEDRKAFLRTCRAYATIVDSMYSKISRFFHRLIQNNSSKSFFSSIYSQNTEHPITWYRIHRKLQNL